ncbi:MAG: glycosyltransferase family A protein [Bacteroidota bacterium]
MPLFSIIIPTHNRVDLLPRAIDSLLEQNWIDWELIVVDDGSSDGTAQHMASYCDDRIHYVYQSHGERSRARNRGIAQARGQYICFLDDDDYFVPNHLKCLQLVIEMEEQAVAVFRTGMIIESGPRQQLSPLYRDEEHEHPAAFFLQHMVGIHTLCFHRSILEKHSFDERWWHFQDTHLLVRALLEYPLHQLPIYSCVYVRHQGMGSVLAFQQSDSRARTENNVAAIRDLFQKGGSRLQELVPEHLEDYLVSEKYLGHALANLRAGNRKLAWQLFRQSFREAQPQWFWKRRLLFLWKYVSSLAQ